MRNNFIHIEGARVHNLKNISLDIPKDKFIVITGISGSGKSSLAFDTLYAEGQRRYVESLSAYARQFLGLMEKPDVDKIEGLSPAIAIEPRKASRNPRSTVATVTEIYDYLRLLFARIGTPYCPDCNKKLKSQTVDEMVDTLLKLPVNTKIQILAPVVKGRKGEYRELFERLKKRGYLRVMIDNKTYTLEEVPELERYKIHTIDLVIDRIVIKEGIRSRLADSIELTLKESDGLVKVLVNGEKTTLLSEKLTCPGCGFSMPELEPRLFSFNSPYGACPACTGIGVALDIDPELLVSNPELSIPEGAIAPWGLNPHVEEKLEIIAREHKIKIDTPWKELPNSFKNVVLYGTKNPSKKNLTSTDGFSRDFYFYEGVIPYLWRRYRNTESDWVRGEITRFMVQYPCPTCGGARLKKEALSIKIRGKSIWDITRMTVEDSLNFFRDFHPTKREELIAHQVLKELVARIQFLKDVGLHYITLDRKRETLSAGEDQRVRLATQIGSGLTGVLYVLDEPSIGLHQRDTKRLLDTLLKLRDLGNTVLVVEHDRQTIERADWIVDLGPGAGEKGGYVVMEGSPSKVRLSKESLTGMYLAGSVKIPIPTERRSPTDKWMEIKGVSTNNLRNIDVRIPLGLFVCVTGVSGSGKSSLIEDTLYRALRRKFYSSREPVGEYKELVGVEHIDKVINIDQSPIGRTPRSNPATYTGVFTPIRELFSSLPEAKARGYTPGRFSFNVKGGRCEACQGDGVVKIEMQFLPDVYVSCEVCKGKRYNRETLDVRYKGKNISDVLNMSVEEAEKFFSNIPSIERKLTLLSDVGLGYIKLGQSAPTLSGGEAQRVKLARELSKVGTGRTLYILDEPTTGLHFEDVKKLIDVLKKLVDKGNTVIIIEHNPDLVKSADWIIDLGPEGGDEGGRIVAEGTPEEVSKVAVSHTGRFLRKELNR